MSYKILSSVHVDDVSEALDANLEAKERSLKAAIQRLNAMNALPAAGGAGHVARLTAGFEAQARQAEKAQLTTAITDLKRQIIQLGGRPQADGTVLSGVDEHGQPRTAMVPYDHSLEAQDRTRVYIRAGRFWMDANNFKRPVDTTTARDPQGQRWESVQAGAGVAIYVMSAQGNFHLSWQRVGERHHSSLLAGQNVACGGEMKVVQGRLTISNESGHYLPKLEHFLQVLHQLDKQNVLDSSVEIDYTDAGGNIRVYSSVDRFMMPRPVGIGAWTRDIDELYDYNNLLNAYEHFLRDDANLVSLNWEWRPARNPPGVYLRGTNTLVNARQVRDRLNRERNPRPNLGPKQKGIGIPAVQQTR